MYFTLHFLFDKEKLSKSLFKNSSKYQMVIPCPIREQFNLKPRQKTVHTLQ